MSRQRPRRRGRGSRPIRRALLALLLVAVPLGAAGVALASPSPIAACPPCDRSFEGAAGSHGVETEISHSEAVVRVHRNGSATWTVRNRLVNASAAERLRDDPSLARAVAADSFGTRYGDGIDHELLGVRVEGETFELRYRTPDVAKRGAGGSLVLTYFREVPGAYMYTGLGADRLTIVAPEGAVIARGFGDRSDDGRRTVATAFPHTRDGPFVVFVPADHPAPGALGTLAVAGELWGIVLRNLALFVALPTAVLAGGLLAVHRVVGPPHRADRLRLAAGLVAGVGVLLVTFVLWFERPRERGISPGGWITLAYGAALVLGSAGATSRLRKTVTYRRLVGGALLGGALAAGVALATGEVELVLRPALAVPVLTFAAVAVGYAAGNDDRRGVLLATALVVAVSIVTLAAMTPLTALGGGLFLLFPVLLTVLAIVGVVVLAPLYRLGGALAAAQNER